MKDDLGFGPRRRQLLSPVTLAAVVVVALVIVLTVAQGHPADVGDQTVRGGSWQLNRRLPLPGLLPSRAPRSAPVPSHVSGGSDTVAPARPADAFRLEVTYVFDGDTVEARAIDPHPSVAADAPVRIRLIGVDAPEGTPTPRCWADEARRHLADLLPDGATVWAAPDAEPRDHYDRALLYLWTEDGRFVNYELVAAGDAEAIRVRPNTAHAAVLSDAQARAQANGAGRWGACE
ncbi:thermonuclease family protein [Microbacterium timonense]|uniref:thermonuclease family protein n=1 Tax=Microbacterium timonense TaxID=2086576 RepID=UPI000D114B17|nr:thermonuclease family protein [Microbacterium timonense]